MARKAVKKSAFKAGMYLLETLTAGMYNNPLAIYREYIQNSADSIDVALKVNPWNSKRINIHLEPSEGSITVSDKGAGISSAHAEDILSSVGLSWKKDLNLRGFRGIGRLGGLAFCNRATFRTKAKDEDVESIQEWGCEKLRQLMSGSEKKAYSLKQLFNRSTTFYQENGKKKTGSYFEVKLSGVKSFRNHLMDIKKVYDFLSVTAPVPFHPQEMSFAKKISEYLASKIYDYSTYDIILNGEPVYKPYRDMVKLTSKGHDIIERIEPFEIKINGVAVAYGWYGQRKHLLGAIAKGQMSSGIRVRVGNIQIGDNHLLDSCFREIRFNSYVVGEIHVNCADLMPNSRRDDFVDNETKRLFYNEIERGLGLPISKQIRLSSRLRSRKKTLSDQSISPVIQSTINLDRRNKPPKAMEQIVTNNSPVNGVDLLAVIKKECKDCAVLKKLIRNE